MKTIVIYSSKTGNTKKIAEAIASALPANTPCVSINEVPADIATYDLAFVGYWVDKGTANAEARQFMESLTVPQTAIFATLGAYPDSEHGQQSLKNGCALIKTNVIDSFICQGKVDPTLLAAMKKMFPNGNGPHKDTPERRAHLAEAAKHPNENDCANAIAFANKVLSTFNNKPLEGKK